MYNLINFSKFTELSSHHHNAVLEHFITPERSLLPLNPFSNHQPQAVTNLLSVSTGLLIRSTPQEWNRTTGALFPLASYM